MFEHILVPLDGSQMSEAALPAACYLAERFSSRVTLVHVVEQDAPSEVHGQAHLRDAAAAEAYLRNVAVRFPAGIEVHCHVHEEKVEDVARSIAAHADELRHDLVVMCSHGKGGSVHLFLGSIAQRVIGLGSLPVLIAHPGPESGFSCGNILVPLDGDPDHAMSLPVARQMAKACGAAVHLVTVVPHFTSLTRLDKAAGRMSPGTTSRMLEMACTDAEIFIEGEAAALRGEGIPSSAHVLRGDPAATITDAADSAGIDLVILATHGKTGMEAFWEGSVAHRICSFSRVPLLLIPLGAA